MKTILKVTVLGICLVLMLLIDVLPRLLSPALQGVPQAHAILGVRRRTAAVTAVAVGGAASAQTAAAEQQAATAEKEAAAAKQQAATAEKEAAAAKQQAAAAEQQAAAASAPPSPPPATGAPLPLGTVVSALPAGCTPTPVGGVEYYHCGGNYYRAAFQGTQLVYVTAKP